MNKHAPTMPIKGTNTLAPLDEFTVIKHWVETYINYFGVSITREKHDVLSKGVARI